MQLTIKVIPNASRTEIVGFLDTNTLKIKVQAPPEGGRANEAVIACIAKALKLPKRAIIITSGQTSRTKHLMIDDMDEAQVRTAFQGTV